MNNSTNLISQFLEKAKSFNAPVEPIKILRSNTYKVGNANILIRTASDLGKRYFFGLNYINAEEIYNLDSSYIAFICGTTNNVIFMPSEVLIRQLPDISHDRNGEYKINFTRDFNLVLRGRGNTLDCSSFHNNWEYILSKKKSLKDALSPDESFHNILQGRLIEIGNIRGYKTFCPDKSKTFNKRKMQDIMTVDICPELQFADHSSLRRIDVIWFREMHSGFYPEYAFEVELSTGVWSGFGRLAALREYKTRLYIISNETRRFQQVSSSFPELRERYINIEPEKIGLLYSAEISLIKMREEFNI